MITCFFTWIIYTHTILLKQTPVVSLPKTVWEFLVSCRVLPAVPQDRNISVIEKQCFCLGKFLEASSFYGYS